MREPAERRVGCQILVARSAILKAGLEVYAHRGQSSTEADIHDDAAAGGPRPSMPRPAGAPPGLMGQSGPPSFGGAPQAAPQQQQNTQPPSMRQPSGPPQFGAPPQRPPMTPNSAIPGPPGFGEPLHVTCTAAAFCIAYPLDRQQWNAFGLYQHSAASPASSTVACTLCGRPWRSPASVAALP